MWPQPDKDIIELMKQLGGSDETASLKAHQKFCDAMLPVIQNSLQNKTITNAPTGEELGCAADIYKKYVKDCRWDILARAMQVLEHEVHKLLENHESYFDITIVPDQHKNSQGKELVVFIAKILL